MCVRVSRVGQQTYAGGGSGLPVSQKLDLLPGAKAQKCGSLTLAATRN